MKARTAVTEETIARFREALETLDVKKFGDLLAPDVVLHSGTTGEDFKGKEAFQSRVSKALQIEGFRVEPHAILADEEHLVGLTNLSARLKGQTYQTKAILVAHVNDEGKLTECWSMTDAPEELRRIVAGLTR